MPATKQPDTIAGGGHLAPAGIFDSASSRLENHTHAVNTMADAEEMVITVLGTTLT